MKTIKCAVCGYEAYAITYKHLKRHDLTVAQYREMYPDNIVVTPKTDIVKERLSEAWRNTTSDDRQKRLQKSRETHELKYSDGHASRDQSVKEKIRKTNMERYNSPNTMSIARKVFSEENNGLNPFQIDSIKDVIKDTLHTRYGVDHPSHIAGHIEKVRSTSQDRFGAPNYMQRNYSEATKQILNNKEQLSSMVKTMSFRNIAQSLDIDQTTLARTCDAFNIPRMGTSIERVISNILDEAGVDYLLRTRKLIKSRKTGNAIELDFVIPDHNLAIEVGGIFHHSDAYLKNPVTYHLHKYRECQKIGLKLLTIFQDEVDDKTSIVRSRIHNMLGISHKGPAARLLDIRDISRDDSYSFLQQYHIQGGSHTSKYCFGAYYENCLVAVMSFKRSWRVNNAIELDRFATDGKSYAGVASRLFSNFVKNHDPNHVVSYADLRWSDGNLYRKIGFKQTIISRPSYTYNIRGSDRLDKSAFRKKDIEHLVLDGHLKSESQIMKELGYKRIYDCGKLRFDWTPYIAPHLV